MSEPHRVAVTMADALMTRPGDLDDAAVAGLREHFTADQLVELMLKVLKFNIQKVAVAVGTHDWLTAEALAQRAWNADGTFVAVDRP